MSIGNRQIGWSQEDNLLWEISKQLDRMNSILCTGPCPTTTSTTTLPPTTTTTTSEAKPFDYLVYRAEKSSNACNEEQGAFIPVLGDGTSFCNSTILTAAGFSALPPGELFISYNGQVRTANHGSGQNFVTFTTGCSTCS